RTIARRAAEGDIRPVAHRRSTLLRFGHQPLFGTDGLAASHRRGRGRVATLRLAAHAAGRRWACNHRQGGCMPSVNLQFDAERLMNAATLAAPRTVRMVRHPVPTPGPGEVRVQLEGCGVCASNLPPWEG